jgi:hypothetical protein
VDSSRPPVTATMIVIATMTATIVNALRRGLTRPA